MHLHWSVRDAFKFDPNLPHILDIVDSLLTLVNDDRLSVARLADGELGLMTGVDLPTARYQGFDNSLRGALARVLKCDKPLCRVALPRWFIYRSEPIQASNADRFSSQWSMNVHLGNYFDFFRPDYLYLDACISVPWGHYSTLGNEFLEAYYYFIKKLFQNKDIILVTGDTRYMTMEHRLVYEYPASLHVISVPARDSWLAYEETKQKLIDANKDGSKTVILCCGPLASVLAYELSDIMRCLDLGHILVDYNRYKEGYGTGNFWH